MFQRYLSERLSSFRMNVFIFIRSPGCSSCREELEYWNKSRYANLVNIVAFVPESASPGSENLRGRLELKYPIEAISDRAFDQIMGRYNYIGRLFLSPEGKVIFVNNDRRGEASRITFANFLEHLLRL